MSKTVKHSINGILAIICISVGLIVLFINFIIISVISVTLVYMVAVGGIGFGILAVKEKDYHYGIIGLIAGALIFLIQYLLIRLI